MSIQTEFLRKWAKVQCISILHSFYILGLFYFSILDERNLLPLGTFGQVFECWDNEGQEHVAIKIFKSERHDKDDAMMEINVLKHLASNRRAKN